MYSTGRRSVFHRSRRVHFTPHVDHDVATRATTRATKESRATNMSDPALGVKSGGDPTQWHGDYDCSACGRKRLPAVEFSVNMQNKYKADRLAKLRCKKCTAAEAEAERLLSIETAKLKVAEAGEDGAPPELHECAECKASKPASEFSGKQLKQKGPGKQRCRKCCDAGEEAAAAAQTAGTSERLKAAREASKRAEATNAPDKLAVFAREAAIEAELVTGLKPQKIGGGGRGRGRGRGSNPNSMLGRGGGRGRG